MIERAIENWLINTTERNYQTPFCQLLLRQGHKIIYNSAHRSMEQGKDIITINAEGEYCAYQLKTGDIDLRKWREIYAEMIELIEQPIQHPSVDRSKIYKSYLVTNGEITDEVRLTITQLNEGNIAKKRAVSFLDVITGKVLLQSFIEAQGDFIPTELSDFNLFLKLFLHDGKDNLPKDGFTNFFDTTVFGKALSKQINKTGVIASSIIINSYLLNSYQVSKNHFALFESWVSLTASAIRHAAKIGVENKEWQDSFNLMFDEMIINLLLLKKEVLERDDFLEGNITVDGGVIYRARTTMVLGALAALENYLKLANKDYKSDIKLITTIKNNIARLWLWGESAVPFFINIIRFLEQNDEGKTGVDLLSSVFLALLKSNDIDSNSSLPSPYYNVDKVLEAVLGINKDEIDFASFSGGSYSLESLIIMLVRRNNKKILEDNWRKISYIQLKEFRSDKTEDFLAWHTSEGVNSGKFPKTPQSWKELLDCANDMINIPQILLNFKDFLPFFILVYPHRLNSNVIKIVE